MAKAKKVPADFSVELTLTREEAEALSVVCSRIGGSGNTTRRKHFDSINAALRGLDIREFDTDLHETYRSIWFKPQ